MRRYLWNFYKLIVSQGKYSQINHVLYLRRNIFEIVVAEKKRIDFHIVSRICSPIIRYILVMIRFYIFLYLKYKARNEWMIQKFPGILSSFKLLYERSRTSRTGNEPKPLGRLSKRFMAKFKILK